MASCHRSRGGGPLMSTLKMAFIVTLLWMAVAVAVDLETVSKTPPNVSTPKDYNLDAEGGSSSTSTSTTPSASSGVDNDDSEAFVCQPPTSSSGPLPPVLPENSYRMLFEHNMLESNRSIFYDVWYDWENQRARVEQVEDNYGVTTVYFYDKDSSFSYIEPRPGADGTTDPERYYLCFFSSLKNSHNYGKPILFYNEKGKPLHMIDIYQALLFGGRYRYAFVNTLADSSSRFVRTNRFSSCIVEQHQGMGVIMNVTYHWTVGKPAEELPIACEMRIRVVTQNGTVIQSNHHILSVVRFDRDPDMADSLFQVPRHVHCIDDPGMMRPENFPKLSKDFAWREETISYDTDSHGNTIGHPLWEDYREVWSSNNVRLARLDWTPTNNSNNNNSEQLSWFDAFLGQPIEAIADINYGALFVTKKVTGECFITTLTTDFPLVTLDEYGTIRLKTPHELLDFTKPHILKGKDTERGNDVFVYSRLADDSYQSSIHEVTFRFDKTTAELLGNASAWVPVSQLNRTVISDDRELNEIDQKVRQTSYFHYRAGVIPIDRFVAPGCIAHTVARFFELRFSGKDAHRILAVKTAFLNLLRYEIFLTGKLGTIMRVQDLDASENIPGNYLTVTFTLLEALLENPSQRGASIDQAKQTLTDAINNGLFILELPEKSKLQVSPLNGSFVELRFAENAHSRQDLVELNSSMDAGGSIQETSEKREPEVSPRALREAVQKSYATINTGYSNMTLLLVTVGFFLLGIVVGYVSMLCWKPQPNGPQTNENDNTVQLTDIVEAVPSSRDVPADQGFSPSSGTSGLIKQADDDRDRPGPSGWTATQTPAD